MTPALRATVARLRELLEEVGEYEWRFGVAGSANVVYFDGEDVRPVAKAYGADKVNLIAESRNSLPALLDALEEEAVVAERLQDIVSEERERAQGWQKEARYRQDRELALERDLAAAREDVRALAEVADKIWRAWSFNVSQGHTHSWHDKADLSVEFNEALARPGVRAATGEAR